MRGVLLLVVTLSATASCTGGDDGSDHHGSDGGQRLVAAPSQRVVQLVEDHDGATVRATTVVTDLFPPYRARTVTHEGRTPDGPSRGGFAWDEGGLYTLGADGSATQTELVAPGFPGPAAGLQVALPVALGQHLVASLGAGTAAGRACTRWLSGLPLDGAPLSPATATDRTESCVDPAGRVLSESWTVRGAVVRTRLAIEIGAGPSLQGDGLFGGRHPVPLPTAESAFVVRPSDSATLARLLGVPEPVGPQGLVADRAVAALDRDAGRTGFSREAGVWTWTARDRLAVLRIERDLGGGGRTEHGAPVALGGLGTGHLEPVLAGLRVTVTGPRGLVLVATADLAEAELLAWLRGLRLGSGG